MTRRIIPLIAAVLFLCAPFAARAASQVKKLEAPSSSTAGTPPAQPTEISQPKLLYIIHSINELEVHAGRLAETHRQ